LKPAVVAGALTALLTGGLMAALTVSSGGLARSLPAIVALTVALVAAGALFGWLMQTERLRMGFGPGILFWIAAFPLARFAQELMVAGGGGPAGLEQGIASFFIYQAMVGGAFGLGFVLLHNQIWMWLSAISERKRSSRSGKGIAS
jgi:hypothetical protein